VLSKSSGTPVNPAPGLSRTSYPMPSCLATTGSQAIPVVAAAYAWTTICQPQVIGHQAQCPPSILRSLPVMKLLALLRRKTAAPRYSEGKLNRPSIL
jgi:hypothetical protein